jgi:hypothetical protein
MKTPLHFACQLGHKQIAQTLVDHQCNVNAKDILTMTPLHWAVERNHRELVELLCKCDKIDLNCMDKFNRTCIEVAIMNNNMDLASYLNDAKNIINIRIQLEKSVLDKNLVDQSQIQTNGMQQHNTTSSNSILKIMTTSETFQMLSTASVEIDSAFDIMSDASNSCSHAKVNFQTVDFVDTSKISTNQNEFALNLNKNKPIEINNKAKAYYNLIEEEESDGDSSDDYSRDRLLENFSSKRKRISQSPVNIEETLNWLKSQSQAMRDHNDDGLENRELFLTGKEINYLFLLFDLIRSFRLQQ